MLEARGAAISQLVTELFEKLTASGVPAYVLADWAGVSNVTLSNWKHARQGPNLFLFEAALGALGYELRMVPITGFRPINYKPIPKGRRAYVERVHQRPAQR